jgi:hypothetical protein
MDAATFVLSVTILATAAPPPPTALRRPRIRSPKLP